MPKYAKITHIEQEDIKKANAEGERIYEEGPRAISAIYNKVDKKIEVTLNNGVEIRFPPRIAQGLSNASEEELSVIDIEGDGLGLCFPIINADLYVPALSKGIFGSKIWMNDLIKNLNSKTL